MAILALKYMLLSKVMLNLPDEVSNIVSGKLALRYSGPVSYTHLTLPTNREV